MKSGGGIKISTEAFIFVLTGERENRFCLSYLYAPVGIAMRSSQQIIFL